MIRVTGVVMVIHLLLLEYFLLLDGMVFAPCIPVHSKCILSASIAHYSVHFLALSASGLDAWMRVSVEVVFHQDTAFLCIWYAFRRIRLECA